MALPRKVCAVCGRTLTTVENTGTGEITYIHGLQDVLQGEDHPAVPIEPGSEQDRPRCDFCNDEDPTRVVPVRDFGLPSVPGHTSAAGWAACDTCADLVDRDLWSGLFRRAKVGYEERHGPMLPAAETALRAMYRDLRKNVKGFSIPLAEYSES